MKGHNGVSRLKIAIVFASQILPVKKVIYNYEKKTQQ